MWLFSGCSGDSDTTAKLRFGHSANINQLLAWLGLFKDARPLRADSYAAAADRAWRTSRHTPMAANIAFVQNNCSGSDDVIGFDVYVNEQRVSVERFCDGGDVCTVSRSQLDELTCDVEQVCSVDDVTGVAAQPARTLSLFVVCSLALNIIVRI